MAGVVGEVPRKIVAGMSVGEVLQAEDIAELVVGVVARVGVGGGGVLGAGVQVPWGQRQRACALAAGGGYEAAHGVVGEGAVEVARPAGSIVRGGTVAHAAMTFVWLSCPVFDVAQVRRVKVAPIYCIFLIWGEGSDGGD